MSKAESDAEIAFALKILFSPPKSLVDAEEVAELILEEILAKQDEAIKIVTLVTVFLIKIDLPILTLHQRYVPKIGPLLKSTNNELRSFAIYYLAKVFVNFPKIEEFQAFFAELIEELRFSQLGSASNWAKDLLGRVDKA